MRTILAILVLMLALATVAHAQNAKRHYERGNAAFALGHFSDAASEYEKAFELHHDPALLYNAAQAHRLAGNKPRALLLYQNYLRVYGEKVQNRVEVERHIDQLKHAIAEDEATANAAPTAPAPVAAPASPQVDEPPPAPAKPVWKKPWFWAVIGGVAVAAGVGLGVGLGLGLKDDTPARDPMPTLGVATWP